MIDLHNHMLPGLDDGAADLGESIKMARAAAEDGIKAVVCTPHWIPGLYENTRTVILERIEILTEKLREQNIQLRLYPGSELRLDASLPQKIMSREVLSVNDSGRHVLIELPEVVTSDHLEHFFWDLIAQGVTPIIAHPERNFYVQSHPEKVFGWVQMGVMLQITGSSLLGRFGRPSLDLAMRFLHHRMVHIVATDSHGLRMRSPKLARVRQLLEQTVGEDRAREMTCTTPKRIISGQRLKIEAPLPFTSEPRLWKKLLGFFGQRA